MSRSEALDGKPRSSKEGAAQFSQFQISRRDSSWKSRNMIWRYPLISASASIPLTVTLLTVGKTPFSEPCLQFEVGFFQFGFSFRRVPAGVSLLDFTVNGQDLGLVFVNISDGRLNLFGRKVEEMTDVRGLPAIFKMVKNVVNADARSRDLTVALNNALHNHLLALKH